MIRDLGLRKTIVLSLLAHGMAVFLFQVKIESPQPIISYQSCRVSFLGSILDDSSFRMVPLGQIEARPSAKSWFPAKILIPSPVTPERRNFQEVSMMRRISLMEWNEKTEVSYPKPLFSDDSGFRVLKAPEFPSVILEGELKKRTVLFQPDANAYFNVHENIQDSLNLSFRFTVAKNGIVEQVEPILLSGRTEMDALGMSYVRQWKFAPWQTKQTGLVRIHLSKKPR